MPSALSLRTDYSPADLPLLAKKTKSNNQSRRLLSLAAVLDGMNRTDAARIGGWIAKHFATGFIVSMIRGLLVCATFVQAAVNCG